MPIRFDNLAEYPAHVAFEYPRTFMSVVFTKKQIADLSKGTAHPHARTYGYMLRHQWAGGVRTMNMIKIAGSSLVADFPDLEALADSTTVLSVVGSPLLLSNLPASFANMPDGKFVYFDVTVIEQMLAFDDDTQGLVFTRTKVEVGEIPLHSTFAVAPYPISSFNKVGGGVPEGFIAPFVSPIEEFITYSIGYACPPMWPPNFTKMKSLG